MKAHPTVQMRYIVGQSMSDHLGGLDELNFDGDFTWGIQEIGRQDAVDAINEVSQANIKGFFEEWNSDESLQTDFAKVGDYIIKRRGEEKWASTFEEKLLN